MKPTIGPFLGQFVAVLSLLPWAYGCTPPVAKEPPKPPELTDQGPSESETEVDPYRLCEAIHREQRLPIYCDFGEIEGMPGMVFVLPDADAMEAYRPSLDEHVVAPFCRAQNQEGYRAVVVYSIANELVQVLDCRTRELSDWRRPNQQEEEAVTVGQVCAAVQESDWPVGCGIGFIGGVESLVLTYAAGAPPELLQRIGAVVAVPFCGAAQENATDGAVYLIEDNARAARFDCLRESWSPWVGVKEVVKDREETRPEKAPSRVSGGERSRTARVEYEFLDASQ